MRRWVVLALPFVVGCSPAAAPSAPVEPARPGGAGAGTAEGPGTRAQAHADDAVEDAAMAFVATLEKCEKRSAMARTITYAEITAMTKKEIDQKEFADEISDFIAARCRELAEPHPKFVGVNVVERKHLEAAKDEMLKRDVDAVIVQFVTEEDGKKTPRGVTFVFFKTDAGWKFSPKH